MLVFKVKLYSRKRRSFCRKERIQGAECSVLSYNTVHILKKRCHVHMDLDFK